MKKTGKEIVQMLEKAASKIVSAEEAKYFADETVETHIRKQPRTNPLQSAIKDIEACIKNKEKSIEYVVDLPGMLIVDFHSHGPLPYIKKIHDELETRSKINGIASVALTNSQSMHTLHAWVQGLAKRGLVAIAVCNGGPEAVIPHNGTRGVFGTNPIAFGLPDKDGGIQCVDMATSEIAFFEIIDGFKNKKQLREQSAVDDKGEFTTDASKALDTSASVDDPVANLTPMGAGYKGYYLVYLLELMTSGLIGSPSSPEMSSDFVPEEHGSMLIVFNPEAMKTSSKLQGSTDAIRSVLEKQESKAGEEIVVPGDRNSKRYTDQKDRDIEIDEKLFDTLKGLAN